MNSDNAGGYICSGITLLTGGLVTDEMVNLILMIIGIVSGLLSIAFTIYKWAKDAKKDGKVTADEVGNLIPQVQEELDKIKEGVLENGKDKRINEEDR